MKITSVKGLAPLIAIIIAAIVIGAGIIVYQSYKTRNEALTDLTSTTLGTEATPTTVLSPTTITIPTSPTTFCLDWDFFKDPKNYDDGQAHEEIKLIQEKLGVTPVGGHYGPLTKAAIDKFNKDYNVIIPESGCCQNITPAHLAKGLTELTLIKFNDLYCSLPKPKITITLINYPTSNEIPEDAYTYIIPDSGYDIRHNIKIEPSGTNITIKTIEVPYSGRIEILPSYSSSLSLYDDNTLVYKRNKSGTVYEAIHGRVGNTITDINPYNITCDWTGNGAFTWHGIKKDRNIKFEFGK